MKLLFAVLIIFFAGISSTLAGSCTGNDWCVSNGCDYASLGVSCNAIPCDCSSCDACSFKSNEKENSDSDSDEEYIGITGTVEFMASQEFVDSLGTEEGLQILENELTDAFGYPTMVTDFEATEEKSYNIVIEFVVELPIDTEMDAITAALEASSSKDALVLAINNAATTAGVTGFSLTADDVAVVTQVDDPNSITSSPSPMPSASSSVGASQSTSKSPSTTPVVASASASASLPDPSSSSVLSLSMLLMFAVSILVLNN
eukprot:NODE_1181_length_966_cov_65.460072_g1136_i0.p1 GENE.NODE_1181_length_966_cov_65.460072_g1136_i0~~NODE_1181_length_966_cov_65.460072_g1136_i0.p1  ORF type:complete len:260 (+),score=34.21 NODE_1181_length_966_cov_65.460072_g1136_i0:86-865(+)